MNTQYPFLISPLGTDEPRTDVALITITGGTEGLPGETIQLTAVCKDADGVTLARAVSWATMNATVATVDDSGLVRLVLPGQVSIVARVERADDFEIPGSATLLTVGDPHFVDAEEGQVLAWSLERERYEPRQPSGKVFTTLAREVAVEDTSFDYDDGRRYGIVADGETDDSDALQNAIDTASSDTPATGGSLRLPAGTIRVTRQMVFSKENITIQGAGMHVTRILFDGVTDSYMKVNEMTYFRPTFRDFTIEGNTAATGKGIDLSAIQSPAVVYHGEFARLYVISGGTSIFAPSFFSMKVDNVWTTSSTGHGFHIHCGPSVLFSNCYAVACGTNKAGYRLTGTINMTACNGVNDADYWGVFGNDPDSDDGFDNEFAAEGLTEMDYPSINLVQCNIEHFTKGGIRIQSPFASCRIGGKLDRAMLTTAYDSFVRARLTPLGGAPVTLDAMVFLGTGNPNGGAALTGAHLIGNGVYFEDIAGTFAAFEVTRSYDPSVSSFVPTLRRFASSDVFAEVCFQYSALKIGRITQRVLRYDVLSLTPSAATHQEIVVTGYTKVKITPTGTYSVDRASFDVTPGTGADFGRNGELIIEAGNGSLTVCHGYAAGNGFRLLGAADLTLAQGQIIRLMRSDNYLSGVAGWVQV